MTNKIISGFNLDFSDIPADGETRQFTINAVDGAQFKLEIKDNTTGYYYNFVTNAFQASAASLQETMTSDLYIGKIQFPAVTGSDDQYDIYLYAIPGTEHTDYVEVRFGDGSIDINNSTGSNSLMMQKVIYQYAALTLTLTGHTIDAAVGGTTTTDTVSINRGKSKTKTPFSFTYTAASTAAYRILKQPSHNDVLTFLQPTIGSAPILLSGENEYPDVSNTDTVDGAIAGGVSNVKVVMDTNVAEKMTVGDKITASRLTDTVDGTVESGVKIVMDNNVASKMSVGDRITGNPGLDGREITVAALNPDGDNAKEFSMSAAIAIEDGTTLGFEPKCNRSLTTVVALNPDTDNVKEFSMSQNIGFVDGVTLSFSKRKNQSWPINNYANLLTKSMIVVPDTNVTAGTRISDYKDSITVFEGTTEQKTIVKSKKSAISTLSKKPTIVKGLVTVQEGQIIFNKQQVFALAGDTLKIGGYGEAVILKTTGWEVKFTDLAVTLTPPTTITTGAVSDSTTVGVADREGVIQNFSTVSGLGIGVSNTDTVDGAITAGTKIVMDNNVAGHMKVDDIVTGSGIPNSSTVTVAELNPDGDNVKEFSVSEAVTIDDGVTLTFTPQSLPVVTSTQADGAGNWTVDRSQVLESGITLTVQNTSRVATVSGNIEIIKAGTADQTFRFDMGRLLSLSA